MKANKLLRAATMPQANTRDLQKLKSWIVSNLEGIEKGREPLFGNFLCSGRESNGKFLSAVT